MSKYSERRRQTVRCAFQTPTHHCPEDGTKLALINGRLDWYCEEHSK